VKSMDVVGLRFCRGRGLSVKCVTNSVVDSVVNSVVNSVVQTPPQAP
jgi:hypothetical protein